MKKLCALLMALCLLLTLTACGGNPPADDTAPTTTTTTGQPDVPADPPAPVIAPTFGAMPKMAQEWAQVYRLSDRVLLVSFIVPGLDTAEYELVCYDLSTDNLLGQVDLGAGVLEVFPLDATSFAVADVMNKTYTVYDTTCAVQSAVTLTFDSSIGSVVHNGNYLLLTDLFTGYFHLYDLTRQTTVPVEQTVQALTYACVGTYGEGFLLHSYDAGLVAVALDGSTRALVAAPESVHAVDATYTGGVIGDYAVFRSLSGGTSWLAPTRGDGETFLEVEDDCLLSISYGQQSTAYYYDLSTRTVAEYDLGGTAVHASLRGTTAVVAVQTADGQPLTFVYVDFADLSTVDMGAVDAATSWDIVYE